jgi:hypothetical protein
VIRVQASGVKGPSTEGANAAVNLDGIHQLLGGQDHSEFADAECGCEGECGCGHQRTSDLDAPWEVPAQ